MGKLPRPLVCRTNDRDQPQLAAHTLNSARIVTQGPESYTPTPRSGFVQSEVPHPALDHHPQPWLANLRSNSPTTGPSATALRPCSSRHRAAPDTSTDPPAGSVSESPRTADATNDTRSAPSRKRHLAPAPEKRLEADTQPVNPPRHRRARDDCPSHLGSLPAVESARLHGTTECLPPQQCPRLLVSVR